MIAHPSVPTKSVSSSELLDFYTGDVKMWGTGDAVIIFDLRSKSGVKDTFYGFLGKTSSRMKSIWMKNMLSGEGRPPEALESEAMMLERVAATPGAIGYINEAKVDGNVVVIAVIDTDKD
ncbi:MAG: hypothetical protein OEN01_11530 [Candidatus Krumholzibacteria bacterium]|nr:hypothetical protein [Candidatus Krumholzibacteria bacterium]